MRLKGGSLFDWAPLFLLAGIAVYFALPREPPLWAAALVAMAALAAAWGGRRGRAGLAIVALLLGGFTLAKLRTDWVAAPLLQRSTDAVLVKGLVEEIVPRGPKRTALILKVVIIEGLPREEQPRRLRLSVNSPAAAFREGQTVSGTARLEPLPVPVLPGGFDYGRTLWFEGIGGTGRFVAVPAIAATPPPWSLALKASIQDVRRAIGERIAAAVGPRLSGFAEALITGERSAIPREVNDSLQVSGLAHVLSISGLHMSLVAGGVFWVTRAALALFPLLAVRRPIKSWSAAAALAVGAGYMVLAGADVATVRSYIMIAVMFFAVMLNRPALSMRNLALAALVILVLQPEAGLSAGFQMSFMAVAGLVALYAAWAKWDLAHAERRPRGLIMTWGAAAVRPVLGIAAATLVAGTLSSIPAAYHFGRIAPLSLLGNLLALPVISLLVMPMAVVSVLAIPFGLETWPLFALEQGLKLVMAISDWVASLPGARLGVRRLPLPVVLGLAGGAIWLCLWPNRWRFGGVGLAAAAVSGLLVIERGPDILIDGKAANVAVRDATGRLTFADPRKGRFSAERWLLAEGDDARLSQAQKREGWSCANSVCRASVRGKRVVFAREGAKPEDLCAEADILVAAFPLRGACRSVTVRIDRFAVWRNGTHALSIHSDGAVTVATARRDQGLRPWTVDRKARFKTAVTR